MFTQHVTVFPLLSACLLFVSQHQQQHINKDFNDANSRIGHSSRLCKLKAGSQYTLLWCNSVQSGTSHKTVDAPTLANARLKNNSIPAALA